MHACMHVCMYVCNVYKLAQCFNFKHFFLQNNLAQCFNFKHFFLQNKKSKKHKRRSLSVKMSYNKPRESANTDKVRSYNTVHSEIIAK